MLFGYGAVDPHVRSGARSPGRDHRRGDGRLMRPDVLNRGYKPATKLLFAAIRLFFGRPLPDPARLVFYRPDFYGDPAKRFTQQAMRRPSA